MGLGCELNNVGRAIFARPFFLPVEWAAMAPSSSFDTAAFIAALRTNVIGRHLSTFESVGSTMDLAREAAAAEAAHGSLILAEEQTAGRGRRGRGFHSPPGDNLYFTLILRLTVEQGRRLPIEVPLAVCEALRTEGVDALIKWPNDIWVNERKLCGMLIDSEVSEGAFIAYPGIGINVNGDPRFNPEIREIATSLFVLTARHIEREALLARVCNGLEASAGLATEALVAAYRDRSLVLGRAVVVSPTGDEPYEAVADAIAGDGSLVVVRPSGERLTLAAGEVSLRPRGS